MTGVAVGEPGLVRARFVRRYKRFLAEVVLDDSVEVVHVPNTGSMATLLHEGVDAWLAPAANRKRKLPCTLVLLGLPDGGLALIDTSQPNRLVYDAIVAGGIQELAGYAQHRREVPIGSAGSRCDLLLTADDGRRCWVEIKNCTQLGSEPGRCDFPDAVTERGARHLHELADRVAAGDRAVQFYLLSRSDCDRVGIARGIDPAYGAALDAALTAGVEVLVYRALLSPAGQGVGDRVQFAG